MAVVSSHQVGVFTRPVPGPAVNANDVRGNDNALQKYFSAHDADATIHVQSSEVADRPAAGEEGRVWLTTDPDPVLSFDDGADWVGVSIEGNAATATALQTARTLWGQSFDGTANVDGDLTAAGAILARPAATQDGVRLLGRAGGTGSFRVDIATATLSANRVLTLANANTTLVSGTMVATGRSLTVAGTANQVISSAGAQTLAADRTWTLSLPQDIDTAADVQFGTVTAAEFIGDLTGNADTATTAGTATLASTVTVADAAADTTTFIALFGSATGSLAPLTDASLTYDASMNTLTVPNAIVDDFLAVNTTASSTASLVVAGTGNSVAPFRIIPGAPPATPTNGDVWIPSAGTQQMFVRVNGVSQFGSWVEQAAVADATGAGDVVAQLNDLLAKLRTINIIAT